MIFSKMRIFHHLSRFAMIETNDNLMVRYQENIVEYDPILISLFWRKIYFASYGYYGEK